MLHVFEDDEEVAAAELKRLNMAWRVTKMVTSDEEGELLISQIMLPSESLADFFPPGSAEREMMESRLGQPDLQDRLFWKCV